MSRRLEVRGLVRRFGDTTVLDGVDLVAEAGSCTAVLGPSGGGKTTLLRLVAGFDRHDAGTIVIGDDIVAGPGAWVAPERRRVGIVPQEGALFPHLDVAGNVGFGLSKHEHGGVERTRRITEVLELVGLPGAERARPHELSGGQQHRVALARALAPRPSVVLLDEPFSALDAGLRVRLRADVREALSAQATTAVIVTHDQSEALSIADQVAVLLDGRVAQAGTPLEIYRAPATLALAGFIGDAVVLTGSRLGSVATCALGTLPIEQATAADGPCQVVIRPEQIAVDAEFDGSGAHGVVVGSQYFGHDTIVTIRIPDGTVVQTRTGAPLAPGTEVSVRVAGTVCVYPTP